MRGLGIQKPSDILKFAFIAAQISTVTAQNNMFPSISTQISATTETLCIRFLSYFPPTPHISLLSITSPHKNKQNQLANWYNKEKRERIIKTWCKENRINKYYDEQLVVLQPTESLAS
jgi:hypothetical protein